MIEPSRSVFLSRLRSAVLADFELELVVCCKVAVLAAAGYKRSEIARRLPDVTPAMLRSAEARVKRCAESLDWGED